MHLYNMYRPLHSQILCAYLSPNLIHLASVYTKALSSEISTAAHRKQKTERTGVTHSLHPHWTPAQSKLPIFAPHFSFGHTILPANTPEASIGSIQVNYNAI